MENPEDLTFSRLELCTYRYLQQVAKSMSLPSNVKKVNLIEMIRARKYCSTEELNAIIVRITKERKQLAQTRKQTKRGRKFRVQGAEVSSTINQSPPISMTPQRSPDFSISYPTGIRRAMLKFQPPNILRPTISKQAIESDRVLRSSNNRRRPNYSILNVNDSVIGVIKAQNALQRSQDADRQYQLSVAFKQHRPINVRDSMVPRQRKIDLADCAVVRQQHVDYADVDEGQRQLVPLASNPNFSQQRPVKRPRRLSGIYPLKPPEKACYQYLPSVGLRQQDGRISKINALVQKPVERHMSQTRKNSTAMDSNTEMSHIKPVLTIQRRNIVPKLKTFVKFSEVMPRRSHNRVTVQEVINYKIDQHDFNNSSTESAWESSTEQESILKKNVNRDAERRSYVTENRNRYTESNFATENANEYTESTIVMAENRDSTESSNKFTEVPVNSNRFTETTDKSQRFTEIRDYATENLNSYTGSTNYAPDDVNGYPENRMYETQNINAYSEAFTQTEARNVETDYPNMSALTDIYPQSSVTRLGTKENAAFTVYYHKKIRAEQVRSQRPYFLRAPSTIEERLPRITDVFSQFNDVQYRNLTQPLYVQVSEEANASPLDNNYIMLEKMYNFKSDLLPRRPPGVGCSHPPLEPLPTTDSTRCVFSTPIITTAIAHPPTAASNNYNAPPFERANQTYVETESQPRLYDYVRVAEQERRDFRCNEVLNLMSSSFETTSSQEEELGANVTIPEMVEDALELISQDGDYMERIGMDVRMQCILCEWAGPKIILEYHITQEHSSEIEEREVPEWSATFSLRALRARRWSSRVLRRRRRLLVLSAAAAARRFVATLTALSADSEDVPKYSRLTVYNKVTGEPHVWEGDIAVLPHTMPYHNETNGLKLDITNLELLPDSANLKLIDGELVANSTAKVVVGQPELDDIEIEVHVKVFD